MALLRSFENPGRRGGSRGQRRRGRYRLPGSHSHFDLLILDLGLPRIHGLEVLRRLRSRGDNLPVLILTGRRCRGKSASKAWTWGADDYMAKPLALQSWGAGARPGRGMATPPAPSSMALTVKGRTRHH